MSHATSTPSQAKNTPVFRTVSLLLLSLIYVSSFVDRQIIAVVGESIRLDLGLNFTSLGWLYGPAFSWVYAIMGLIMGSLADRYSRVRIILLGAATWSFATIASGWASSFGFLVAMRMALGLSQAALSPAVYSLLADWFSPAKRATVFSAYASSIFIGVGLSFLIGGTVAQSYDWRVSLQVLGWGSLALVGLGFFGLKEPSRDLESPQDSGLLKSWSDLKELLSKPALRYHLVGFSLLAMSGYTLLAFVGSIFRTAYDRSDLVPTYGWFLFGTALAVSLAGWITDRWAKRYGARNRLNWGWVSGLGALPLLAYGLHTSSAEWAFWAIGLANIIASSYNGVAAATIQFFAQDHQRGMAGALYLFVVSIVGFGAGPPLAGWLSDTIFSGPMAVSSAVWWVYVLCGVLSAVAFYQSRKYYEVDRVQ